jgi:Skp family chaperone for outer membrane proteins
LKRVQSEEVAVKEAEKKLAAERTRKFQGLPWRKAARKKLEREVEAKNKTYEQDRERQRHALEEERTRAIQVLGKRLLPVAQQYSRDHGFSVISDSASVFVAGQGATDVTEDLIKAYEAFYPEVPKSFR